jgi:hypothetical protein
MVNVYVSAGLKVPSNCSNRETRIKTILTHTAKMYARNTTYGALRADFDANSCLHGCYASQAGK